MSYSEGTIRQKNSGTAGRTELAPLLLRLSAELQGMVQRTSGAEQLVSQLICGSTAITPEMMKSIQGLDLLRQLQEDAAVLLNQIAMVLPAGFALVDGQLEAGLRLDAFVHRVVWGNAVAADATSDTVILLAAPDEQAPNALRGR